ncbi:unnamed protein product, partial [Prorocentrum cordatum]
SETTDSTCQARKGRMECQCLTSFREGCRSLIVQYTIAKGGGSTEARSRRLRLHVQEGHGELHRLFNAGAHGQAVPGGGQQDSDPGGAAGAPQRRPAHPGHRDPSDHRWRRRPVGGRLRPLRRAARG